MKLYPNCKSSGVPWFGDVPSHWQLKKVKHITRHTTGWTPPTGDSSSYDGNNAWATIGDLGELVIVETKNRISDAAAKKAGLLPSPVGSLLFSFKLSVGQVSIAGVPLYTNEAIATFLPSENYVVSWAFYAFSAFIPENCAINIYGAKLLNQQRINDATLIVPTTEEQKAIANYLDAETARIDALIREKMGLIELLRERRQSDTTAVLLGGMDNEQRRASGTPWLGDIPKSWTLCRLKHAISAIEQGWSPECENRLAEPDEWGILKAGACNHGVFSDGEHKAFPITLDPLPAIEVRPGDVLMSRASGSADLVGSVAYVEHVRPLLMLSDKIFRLVPEGHVSARYLAWSLNTLTHRLQILNSIRGSAGLARNITTTDIKQLWLALPPLQTQLLLVESANKIAREIDKLIEHAQAEIVLLKELRTSTIAEAVLGRVDVRSTCAK